MWPNNIHMTILIYFFFYAIWIIHEFYEIYNGLFREKMSAVIILGLVLVHPFLFLVNRCENVTKTVDPIQPYFSHPCRITIGPGRSSGG